MELVAPAGNLEKLSYVYSYGADSAYIGLKRFSLRIKADNFYDKEYEQIKLLKEKYPLKRLFCALNISFHNKDIDHFISEIDYFKQYPIDSFIVQDIGIVPIVQKYFPKAHLHLSTQANCINREAVKVYRSMGFSRVVLGREASLTDIREIKDACPEMELEVFAHGAMCIAYSGRCLISAYTTGRSANSGFCSHSCRWDYKLLEEREHPGEYFPVFEGDDYTAILSSKDLCMIDHLDDMKKAGVDSLKIEGRMKSLYYAALVTRAYRKAIDSLEGKISVQEAKPFVDELYKTAHREFSTGFFYSREDADKTTAGETKSEYEMAGTIGDVLSPQEEQDILHRAKTTEQTFTREMDSLHPSAREAKEKDLLLHPEKKIHPVQQRDGYKFYQYRALNKISASTALEFIGPDCTSVSDTSYVLVNPENGAIMDWVCHNHDCLIYTSSKVESSWIARFKNTD